MSTPAPPTRIYPPGGLQLTVKLVQSGQTAAVVLGAEDLASTPTAAMGNAWLAAFWGNLYLRVTPTVQCVGGILRDVSEPDGASIELPAPANGAGVASGGTTVAASSYLIRWNTGQGGRSRRGRTFLPGVSADRVQADGRTLVTNGQNEVQASAQVYLNAFGTGALAELQPAVLSFTKGLATPITSCAVASTVGIQRRRMRG